MKTHSNSPMDIDDVISQCNIVIPSQTCGPEAGLPSTVR